MYQPLSSHRITARGYATQTSTLMLIYTTVVGQGTFYTDMVSFTNWVEACDQSPDPGGWENCTARH